jgi:hypothetical protein
MPLKGILLATKWMKNLASVTKLYTHSVIFAMQMKGLLIFKNLFYLEKSQWQEINTIVDNDYSDKITVQMLLDQNSGIADYETDLKMMSQS